jgi:hypothetical protein
LLRYFGHHLPINTFLKTGVPLALTSGWQLLKQGIWTETHYYPNPKHPLHLMLITFFSSAHITLMIMRNMIHQNRDILGKRQTTEFLHKKI